jgi:hypothetical protein
MTQMKSVYCAVGTVSRHKSFCDSSLKFSIFIAIYLQIYYLFISQNFIYILTEEDITRCYKCTNKVNTGTSSTNKFIYK